MKKIAYSLFLCAFLFSFSKVSAQILANPGIQWVSMETAQELNKKDPKPFFIDVYTHWCGPCKMLSNGTFKDPAIVEYVNDNFYPVKFNAEHPDPITFAGKTYNNPGFKANQPANRRNSPHELTRHFQVPGYPTMMVLDKDLKTIGKIVGYKNADQLMQSFKGLPLGS